jgi:hypothetical protein
MTAIGCGTGIVCMAIDKLSSIFDGRRQVRAGNVTLKLTQEKLRERDEQIVELHRQNESLQKQVEWHSKLLEAQERGVRQLGSASTANGSDAGTGEAGGNKAGVTPSR